ncbi:MAG: hypothetical protein KAH84_11640 [Thiomargarita sp.]|nr:hypothetical protein [Thiomargarita sp.]
MKIVLGGPPHSGKSCLREGLKQAIKTIPDTYYLYVITACPDGEGCWHYEAVTNDPKNAKALKEDYKGQFTDDFVKRVSKDVKTCELPLTLIDIGGKTSEENEMICAGATHIILLAGDLEELPVWREFSKKLDLQIIAEVRSDLNGKTDEELTFCENGICQGSIHHLKRGDSSLWKRPTVKQLAQLLVTMEDRGERIIKDMTTFYIDVENDNKLKIGFGRPAQNDEMVKDVEQRLDQLIKNEEITGGKIIKINGPASLPVGMVFAHKLSHLYQAVACYDPKLNKYVVAIAHGDIYSVGDLID